MESDSKASLDSSSSSSSSISIPQSISQHAASSSPSSPSSSSKPVRYKNKSFLDACSNGDLPLAVMLWDMAESRNTSVMIADSDLNTPFHYAALASTPEVLAFLYQKHTTQIAVNGNGNGPVSSLIDPDAANAFGETPLLKSMTVGYPLVIRYLLDKGANPFSRDNNNSSAFIVLAKFGHPWALNYAYRYIEMKHGADSARELLAAEDKDGYSAIDWAADSGDVNVIEYLVRRGIDPLLSSSGKRKCLLALAVQSGQLHASVFLLACGCNPHAKDGPGGLSAYDIAKARGFTAILPYIERFHEPYWQKRSQQRGFVCYSETDEFGNSDNFTNNNHSRSIGRFRSHAIYRQCTPRVPHFILHSCLIFVAWLLTLCMPFYAWCIFCIASLCYFTRMQQQQQSGAAEAASGGKGRRFVRIPSYSDVILAPERLLGVWGGSVAAIVMYLSSCSAARYSSGDGYRYYGRSYGFAPEPAPDAYPSPLGIGATSGGVEQPALLAVCWFTMSLAIASWVYSVWCCSDAGCIDTRYTDFEDCFNDSFLSYGAPPPSSIYCPTTLVKKPMRSKYCAQTGFVVARMDHYCIWLCNSVGYANHRAFVLFLVAHVLALTTASALLLGSLAREVGLRSGSAELLLGRLYFFPLLLCAFTLTVSVALARLLILQLINIARNLTVNEEINYCRYSSYMSVNASGRLETKFNSGVLANVLEFMQIGPYSLDYYACFEPPHPNPNPSPNWGGSPLWAAKAGTGDKREVDTDDVGAPTFAL